MNIKEYLDKNLPSLNFNILPQVFEENDAELTEEIIEYLKNSPWNTNWNVIKLMAVKTEPTPEPEPTPAMTGIEIIEEPTRTTYYEGDTLDLTGLRVIGHWEGNITDELDYSEYVTTPANGATLTNDIMEVVISVGNFEDSFAITVHTSDALDPEMS